MTAPRKGAAKSGAARRKAAPDKSFHVTLPGDLHSELESRAKAEDLTMAQLSRRAMRHYLGCDVARDQALEGGN